MKPHLFFRHRINTLIIFLVAICCNEHPIESNLSTNLIVDTLSINSLNISSYAVAPNLATNERLYLGEKNGIQIPYSFIKIGSSNYWSYYNDSTITFDSIQFKLYFDDSLQNSDLGLLELYFSPDSHFNENSSTYLDYEGFSISDWFPLGAPSILNKTDSSNSYTHSELVWSVDSLMYLLSDSSITRTFALKFANNDSNFIELYSEEATIEEKDPKVILFYKRTYSSSIDSVLVDTLSNSIYSSSDLSIFDPGSFENNLSLNRINNGLGRRIFLTFPFNVSSLQNSSIIRSANLIIPIDSSDVSENFNIIIDPIENDSLKSVDSNNTYAEDPLTGIGYPYRLSNTSDSSEYIVSIKNILQNIILGNEINYGFKIVSEEKNNPFDSIWFLSNDSIRFPKIEIIYIYNEY